MFSIYIVVAESSLFCGHIFVPILTSVDLGFVGRRFVIGPVLLPDPMQSSLNLVVVADRGVLLSGWKCVPNERLSHLFFVRGWWELHQGLSYFSPGLENSIN